MLTVVIVYTNVILVCRIIFDRALTEFNDENTSENTENQWLILSHLKENTIITYCFF